MERPNKPTKKFEKMCEIYLIFSKDEYSDCASFTDQDKLELFYAETFGDKCSEKNGYAIGKKWMDVNIAMWIEDNRKGELYVPELYGNKFPSWWLNKVLNRDGPYDNGFYDHKNIMG